MRAARVVAFYMTPPLNCSMDLAECVTLVGYDWRQHLAPLLGTQATWAGLDNAAALAARALFRQNIIMGHCALLERPAEAAWLPPRSQTNWTGLKAGLHH